GGYALQRRPQFGLRDFQFVRGLRADAVETRGVFEHRGIAARLDVGQYRCNGDGDLRILRRLEGQQFGEPRVEIGLGGGQPAHDQPAGAETAREKASISGWIIARLTFSAAWLTTRRELTGAISSTATRLLAFSVPPVLTRSTMASARPTSGASSIDPYSLIRSTYTPLPAKCSRAACTYLVATRKREPWRTAAS